MGTLLKVLPMETTTNLSYRSLKQPRTSSSWRIGFSGRFRGGAEGARSPFFAITCFFWNQFEELQNVLIEVKLITDKAPFICVYPNTIKTYLTFNHLLIGRQLLCYSNSSSAVFRNLTVLSSTTDKINRISNHFWHRWRHEYVVNLCETQRASKLNINSQKLCCASLWWKGAQTLLENCHSNRGIT